MTITSNTKISSKSTFCRCTNIYGRERKKTRESKENYKLEMVDNFKYFGVVINNRNGRNREAEHIIQAGTMRVS